MLANRQNVAEGMKKYFQANPDRRYKKLTEEEVLEIRKKHSA